VTHWHGDVAASHKRRLLEKPEGILQITPESLEAMLINRSNDIPRLFGDLRFVVIDEIHTLTGTDRGNQIICLLSRIAHLIGYHPRRIALSATIGDPTLAAEWLNADTGRDIDVPELAQEKIRWRLGLEHFYIQNPEVEAYKEQQKKAQITESKPDNEVIFVEKTADAPDSQNYTENSEAYEKVGGSKPYYIDPGYEYAYDCVKDKKSLVF
jgi:ATP-dependent Lhr-like helicase